MFERSLINTQGTALRLTDNLNDFQLANLSSAEAKSLIEIERSHIIKTLEAANWKVEWPGGTVRMPGLNASTLRTLMNKLDIRRPCKAKVVGG